MTGWWDYLYPPGRSGSEAGTKRPCGCLIDPVVFGHGVLHLIREPS